MTAQQLERPVACGQRRLARLDDPPAEEVRPVPGHFSQRPSRQQANRCEQLAGGTGGVETSAAREKSARGRPPEAAPGNSSDGRTGFRYARWSSGIATKLLTASTASTETTDGHSDDLAPSRASRPRPARTTRSSFVRGRTRSPTRNFGQSRRRKRARATHRFLAGMVARCSSGASRLISPPQLRSRGGDVRRVGELVIRDWRRWYVVRLPWCRWWLAASRWRPPRPPAASPT